jgi:hypothetical protein
MGISFGTALGAGLGGLGGLLGGYASSALEQQKLEEVKARLAIEQQRADQQMEMQQNQLAQNQSQFEAARAPIAIPESLGGGTALKEMLPFLFAKADAEAKRTEEAGRLNAARSAILNQPGRPEAPMPAEGAMYSEAETLPGKDPTPKNVMLAAILGHPQADAILKQLYPEDTEKFAHAGPGAIYSTRTGAQVGTIEGPPKEPTAATTYSTAVEGLLTLKRQGVAENDPRYVEMQTRVNLLKPMAVQEGGFIGGPGGGAPLITGLPKTVSGETAQRVAGAGEARLAAQKLVELSTSGKVADYLGPVDQWRGTAQRMIPGALAGEVPPDVVDMNQALNTLNNYYINLISGAAVSAQEGERLKAQLPKLSSRPEVFQREVQTTLESVARLEQRISQLALHGDPKARALAEQYGLGANGGNGAPPSQASPKLGEPGYTGRVVQPDMPQAAPKPGKVWIKAPDGVWGQWDARQPIPQGYMR